MNTPLCTVCHVRTCWWDSKNSLYSPYCGNTCRLSQNQNRPYQPTRAVQGQPICRICDNVAYFDGFRWSPGCSRTHAQMAIARGCHTPR